ncbi:MAG: nucleoside-diphosphate sugar epimerase/dehydratase [Sphaerochaetaceae bacterium]|nr:nucleoside-diphosphate sugar epimerase/dehydratase [Sphaerochaetaceae bacterium]
MERERIIRQGILVCIDSVCLLCCAAIAAYLSMGRVPLSISFWGTIVMIGALQIISLAIVHVYRIRLVNSSLELLTRIIWALIPAAVFGFVLQSIFTSFSSLLVRFGLVYYVFSFVALAGYRIFYRMAMNRRDFIAASNSNKAIVYGAGEIGSTLVRQFAKGKLEYKIVGFVDDDPSLQGVLVTGIPVLGAVSDLEQVMRSRKAGVLIIAITNLSGAKMQMALDAAVKTDAKVQIIPSLFELNERGNKNVDLRSINYEDLLGRQMVEIDRGPIEAMVTGRRVLVTGAGGSIGGEICRQLLSFHPSRLLLLDIDETELHDLSLRLHNYAQEFSQDIFPVCCDIKNGAKVDRVFERFQPEIVFHAAAYKHVPMMEYYPEEAIRTNVAGSYNVLSSAVRHHARKVIVISTDKAVNPTNVMGATKRVVELEASMLTCPQTEIVCVRFGNVLGSRGSMLPLFLEQIREGRPITVTHKDIIRYFMTIPEAVSLVFLAGAMAKGGEVMVLDMGDPVRIYDFAQKLVSYFGDGRSKVVVTGLRPGEKLYEELLADKDLTIPTDNKKVFKAKVTGTLDKAWVEENLKTIHTDSTEVLLKKLQELVPEFHYQGPAPLADLVKEDKPAG